MYYRINEVVAKEFQAAKVIIEGKGYEPHVPRTRRRPKVDGAYIHIVDYGMYVVIVERHRECSAIDAKDGKDNYSGIYERLYSHLLSISDGKKGAQGLY
jgi:hypothetical protein